MRKRTYFDKLRGPGWPSPNEMEHYFLSASGRRQAFDIDNDCWGLSAEGVDGTEHLPAGTERIDIRLTIMGNLRYGAFLHYARHGGTQSHDYFSKTDLKRLREWIETKHGDLRPVGLFIPIIGVGAVSSSGQILLNYVSPDARFRGVSKAILNQLESKALERGHPACAVISTATARRFYRSAGYEQQGAPAVARGVTGYPMVKQLSPAATG
jgi:GNAT superfamily N-acetyltransferase